MPNNRVLVVGEGCNDIFIYGNASRLCPDVPAPVFIPKCSTDTPGMAGNTARNLESLGLKVDLIQQQEVIKKTKYIDSKLNYTFLRVDEGEDKVTPFDESIIHEREIREYDAVVISDYGKGFLSESDIEKFCKNNANTFLDTKKILGDYCREAKIIKINSPEIELLKGYVKPWAPGGIDLNDWVDRFIVTLGDRGCMYYRERGFQYYNADRVDVFDLAGAGDTFLAALVAKYLEANNIEDAIRYANKKSAEVVQKKGVSVVSPSVQSLGALQQLLIKRSQIMTMNSEDVKDKRFVCLMGQIPLGEEDKYRYPTEFELEMMLYESEALTEEEYDAMTEKEFSQWRLEAEETVKERLSNNL